MSEIIQAPAIAKIVGCDKNKVRYNMKNGFWEFGRVIKTGPKKHRYEVILSILVYTFFSRMFDLMLPPVAKHSIVVA